MIISPHAGIEYSGEVAAFAYKQIKPDKYERVIILGPSHYTDLNLCALTTCKTY